VGHEPGTLVDALQTLVSRVLISLAVQNLLEEKMGIPYITVPARASAFEVDPIYSSERNR
jgi:hypothetical protein